MAGTERESMLEIPESRDALSIPYSLQSSQVISPRSLGVFAHSLDDGKRPTLTTTYLNPCKCKPPWQVCRRCQLDIGVLIGEFTARSSNTVGTLSRKSIDFSLLARPAERGLEVAELQACVYSSNRMEGRDSDDYGKDVRIQTHSCSLRARKRLAYDKD